MIVAIHQPLFAPWAGYFHKMLHADVFVLLDHVEYTHNNRINRNEVRLPDGRRIWLTVPVRTHGRSRQSILDVEVANRENPRWRRKHRTTLEQSYRNAAHWPGLARILEDTYENDWDRIVDLDRRIITALRDALGIGTRLVRSSELTARGSRSDLLVEICRELGADAYLSGSGGSLAYLDEEPFRRAGVAVSFQDYRPAPYAQGGLPFEPGLSGFDLLAHAGPLAPEILRASGGVRSRAEKRVSHA